MLEFKVIENLKPNKDLTDILKNFKYTVKLGQFKTILHTNLQVIIPTEYKSNLYWKCVSTYSHIVSSKHWICTPIQILYGNSHTLKILERKFQIMRIRNNKVNVFLSDDEKFILKRDSSRLNLSQSEYIRNLIIGYEIKIPEVKEEQKPKKDEYVIENIVKALEENIECLIKVKNRFHHLGYFEDERAIGTKIEFLKIQNSTLKKYIPIDNDKDNAN